MISNQKDRKEKFVNKKELRKEILTCRDEMSNCVREEKSHQIANYIIMLEAFQKSTKVFLYAPIRSEVDTQGIYYEARRQEKEVYYPVVHGDEMEFYRVDNVAEFKVGTFGVREPEADEIKRFVPNENDCIVMIIPGAVFDKEGNRIGYGKGYYDKYLQKLTNVLKSASVCKIALAYECQIVDVGEIVSEVHDIRMDYVATEVGLITCAIKFT